ncbi:MAG: hypothetical protein R3F43_26615 [bacterium]
MTGGRPLSSVRQREVRCMDLDVLVEGAAEVFDGEALWPGGLVGVHAGRVAFVGPTVPAPGGWAPPPAASTPPAASSPRASSIPTPTSCSPATAAASTPSGPRAGPTSRSRPPAAASRPPCAPPAPPIGPRWWPRPDPGSTGCWPVG